MRVNKQPKIKWKLQFTEPLSSFYCINRFNINKVYVLIGFKFFTDRCSFGIPFWYLWLYCFLNGKWETICKTSHWFCWSMFDFCPDISRLKIFLHLTTLSWNASSFPRNPLHLSARKKGSISSLANFSAASWRIVDDSWNHKHFIFKFLNCQNVNIFFYITVSKLFELCYDDTKNPSLIKYLFGRLHHSWNNKLFSLAGFVQ